MVGAHAAITITCLFKPIRLETFIILTRAAVNIKNCIVFVITLLWHADVSIDVMSLPGEVHQDTN